MRFYFQESGQKIATKCIRISSTATTKDVILTLIEKFRPDMRMLSKPIYTLYEVHQREGMDIHCIKYIYTYILYSIFICYIYSDSRITDTKAVSQLKPYELWYIWFRITETAIDVQFAFYFGDMFFFKV